MASPSLSPQFDTNAISNCNVIEEPKAHGKNYIKVKPLLVSHLLRNRLFVSLCEIQHPLGFASMYGHQTQLIKSSHELRAE